MQVVTCDEADRLVETRVNEMLSDDASTKDDEPERWPSWSTVAEGLENDEWNIYCAVDEDKLYPVYCRKNGGKPTWDRPVGVSRQYATYKYEESVVVWARNHPEEIYKVIHREPVRDFNCCDIEIVQRK